ncbi:MAG TPA: hypothetical protein VIM41_08165 [Gammaproteobacteria bacterium]
MKQLVFGSDGGNSTRRDLDQGEPSPMDALFSAPDAAGVIGYSPADITRLWQQLRTCLQDYFNTASEELDYPRVVAIQTHQLLDSIKQLPEFRRQLQKAKSRSRYDHLWHRQRFAFDSVMEAELVTVYGEQSTPLHSYDGPVGIIYVLDGELTVGRYTEINNAISACSGITKLNCQTINRYRYSQGTLIDSISAPVVELQANAERCVFLNIHLIDLPSHPHYCYYPSYISRENRQFFTRRVTAEW